MSYGNETTTSSPDPLGMSHDNLEISSPLKQRRDTPRLTPRKALGESSDNVRLHDIYLNTSPAGKTHFTSPNKEAARPPISPWRIRVIVQAEPEVEKDNTSNAKLFAQPSIGRTTTTIIPLKEAGEFAADSPRRSGARSQKSIGKRPGTPKPTASSRRGSISMSPEKDHIESRIAITPKRGRGRPRKSLGGLSETLGENSEKHNTTAHVSPLDDLDDLGILGEMTGPRRRQRKKASIPSKHATHPDAVHQGSAHGINVGLRINEKGIYPQKVNGLKRKLDQTATPDKAQRIKRPYVVTSSPKRELSDSMKTSGLTSRPAQEYPTMKKPPGREKKRTQSNAIISEQGRILEAQRESDDNHQSLAGANIKENGHDSSAIGHLFSDPTNEPHEFDSILESEGFSMISVSTLPSGKIGLDVASHGLQGNAGDSNLETDLKDGNPRRILSPEWPQSFEAEVEDRLKVPSQDEEVLSVSSVENIARLDTHQTSSHKLLKPSNLLVSRPLSSENAPRVLDEVTGSTPKKFRVVHAGTVLQGVMGPQELAEISRKGANQEPQSLNVSETGPEAENNNLFNGFGAGTQRELRAGLRLGEELAKRLPGYTSPNNLPPEEDPATVGKYLKTVGSSSPKEKMGNGIPVLDAEQNIAYPVISNVQLPSPERSEIDADEDQMILNADTPSQPEQSMREDLGLQCEGAVEGVSYSLHNRTMEREAEWQREREAVVKQIEMANSSRVIIIDGDTELQDEQHFKEEMEESDIWQAEARASDASLSSSGQEPCSIFPTQMLKPRRSQIPSPWRRQGQLGPTVQRDVESDLFWQPGRAASAGAGSTEEQYSSSDPPISDYAARPRRSLGSSGSDQLDGDSGLMMTGPNSTPRGGSSRYVSVTPGKDVFLEGDIHAGLNETQSSGVIIDTIERHEPTAGQPDKAVDLPRPLSSQISIRHTNVTKISKANGQSRTRTASKPVAITSSISWLGYIATLVPGWGQPAPPRPLPRLPNGQRRLPVAISEGPLSLYKPWTLDHWKALYVHYAAAREGRATFRFNRFGPTAWHVGVSHRFRQWQKPITREDSAIADAFLSDLRRRGVGTPAPPDSVLIDDYVVLGKLFYMWMAGVMNGECEVGVGKTGWAIGSEEWWRPDMESWYQGHG